MSNLADARMPAPDTTPGELRVPERATVAVASDLVQALMTNLVGKRVNCEMPSGTRDRTEILTDVSVFNGQIGLWFGDGSMVLLNQVRRLTPQ